MKENPVKQKLKAGMSCIGTMVKTTDPAVVEVIGCAGFEFVMIDTEHTAMSDESMLNLIRACDLTGIVPTVRVRTKSAAEILKVLDAGSQGVQVPQIESGEEAREVVNAVKYYPAGNRGFAASQRSARYGFMDPREYAQVSNQQTMIALYCETLLGFERLDEVLAVDGVDIIFMGPYDLSQAFGVIGEPKHPKVREAMQIITDKTRKAGKAAGTIAADAEEAQRLIDMGIQYILMSSDLGMIAQQSREFLQSLR